MITFTMLARAGPRARTLVKLAGSSHRFESPPPIKHIASAQMGLLKTVLPVTGLVTLLLNLSLAINLQKFLDAMDMKSVGQDSGDGGVYDCQAAALHFVLDPRGTQRTGCGLVLPRL